jgi:hypothetical protein
MSKSGGMLVANREATLSPYVNSQQLLEEIESRSMELNLFSAMEMYV